MTTCTKKSCATLAHAQADCDKLKVRYKAKHVPDWKNLNAYQCPDCGLFHLGHSFKSFRKVQPVKPEPAQAPIVPSSGALRRKLARLDEKYDRRLRYKAAQFARIVARDLEQLAEDEYQARQIAERAADLADSIAAARKLTEKAFTAA